MVYQILEKIAATSSRLEKESILESNKNSDVLKKVFFLAYDPFIQFYIKKIPQYTTTQESFIPLETALDRLDHLSSRNITGNAAIDFLSLQLSMLHPNDADVLERVIKKDLACGASASTANKIWPNLIHEYPCMLCSPYEQKAVDKMSWPAMVQLKMDGMRFNAIVKDGSCEFRSRSGKEIDLKGELKDTFIKLADGNDLVFDGELIVLDENGEILNRQTGNGILNKAVKGTISINEAKMVGATLWDAIPYEDFKNGYCGLAYKFRFELVKTSVSDDRVKVVEYKIVESIDEAREIFESYLVQGQEGIILKNMNSAWENKRVKHHIKFKAELDCDLEVIGYEEGTGKYKGMLGALLLGSRSDDEQRLVVSVGSGFDDDSRASFWAIRDSLIGKIVTVIYNAKITNKQGGISLFLPRFIEVREDKTISDREVDIK